jgi:aspartyl-tRNA(Asn)/glutamyl-tRNA(Gln) amidotransferase subunit A
MPVGLQFLGQSFGEASLLGVAHAYERSQPWFEMHPDLRTSE